MQQEMREHSLEINLMGKVVGTQHKQLESQCLLSTIWSTLFFLTNNFKLRYYHYIQKFWKPIFSMCLNQY